MKKRFLCAALTVALVAAEILPAAAAETQPAAEAEQIVVSDGEVVAEGDVADQGVEVQDAQQIVREEEAPEEQIAEEPAVEEDLQETAETVSENDAEAEESEDEIDAQGQAAYAAPVDFKENYPLGKDTVLTFNVDKGKSFSYTIKQGTTVISSNPATALPSNTGSSFDQISITLPLSNKGSYPVGTYTLIVLETNATEESFNRSFKIARSIGTENTELVTRPTIVESSIVYTGNDITPQVTIVDKVGGQNKTLKQGTDFKVTVTSANKKNIGKASCLVEGIGSYAGSVALDYVIKPQAPNLPTAVCISDSAIKLGWNKVAIAQTYQVWRKKASEKNYVKIADVKGADTLTYTDSSNKVLGEKYCYYVTAVNSGVSSVGNTTGTQIYMTTSAPKLNTATAVNTKSIKLSWSKAPSAAGYNIYSVNADGSLKSWKTGCTSTSCTIKKLTCGTKYNFVVKAYVKSIDGKSKLESVASNTLKAQAKPATPKMVSAKSVGGTEIEVKWKKVSDCTGYIVYRKLASGGSWKKLKTIKKKATVTYVDKKAKTGKNYVYTVLAYKKVKGKQIKGAMNSKGKKTMAVCAAPRMEVTRIKTDSNEVVLWNPDGVTGYYLYRKTGNGSYTKIKTIPASKIDVTVYFDPVDSSYIYTYYAVPYSKVGSKKVKGYKTGEITEKRLNAKK